MSAKLLEVLFSLPSSSPFLYHIFLSSNLAIGKDEPTKTNRGSRILCAEGIHTRTMGLPGHPPQKMANLSAPTLNNSQSNQSSSSVEGECISVNIRKEKEDQNINSKYEKSSLTVHTYENERITCENAKVLFKTTWRHTNIHLKFCLKQETCLKNQLK